MRLEKARKVMASVTKTIDAGYIRACHDLSEGGLAVSAAEMMFSEGMGLQIDLRQIPYSSESWRDDLLLFSESNSRFLVEVESSYEKAFNDYLRRVPHAKIGEVSNKPVLSIRGLKGNIEVSAELDKLYNAWCERIEI